MASFVPPCYEITAKAGVERLLISASLVYTVGDTGLFIVDRSAAYTAEQIRLLLDKFVQVRLPLPTGKPVTELLPTTV